MHRDCCFQQAHCFALRMIVKLTFNFQPAIKENEKTSVLISFKSPLRNHCFVPMFLNVFKKHHFSAVPVVLYQLSGTPQVAEIEQTLKSHHGWSRVVVTWLRDQVITLNCRKLRRNRRCS